MPKTNMLGDFIVDPNFDSEKDLADYIESVRLALTKDLSCIDSITEPTIQAISMFALIDCLAQEESNYPSGKKAKEAFCDFVLKYQKQCDYLECVEPVTLYYRVEEFISDSKSIQEYLLDKELSLDSLEDMYSYRVRNIICKGKSEEILKCIADKKGKAFADRLKKEHQLISLMYRMRSKAVHEMSGLGVSLGFNQDVKPNEPYYLDIGRMYVDSDKVVSDDVVELIIPNAFIRNILADCIDGYLNECRRNKRIPFINNAMTRKHKLSWYDK